MLCLYWKTRWTAVSLNADDVGGAEDGRGLHLLRVARMPMKDRPCHRRGEESKKKRTKLIMTCFESLKSNPYRPGLAREMTKNP